MRLRRWIAAVVALTTVAVIASVWLRGGDNHTEKLPIALPEEEAALTIKDVRFFQTQDGTPQWQMVSGRIEMLDKVVLLKGAAFTFRQGTEGALSLSGEEGRINMDTRDFSVQSPGEGVVLQLKDGYIVRSTGLRWVDGERKIVSEGPATLFGAYIFVKGDALTMAVDDSHLRFSGHVETTLRH